MSRQYAQPFGRTFRDVTGESPSELRAREKAAPHELERVRLGTEQGLPSINVVLNWRKALQER